MKKIIILLLLTSPLYSNSFQKANVEFSNKNYEEAKKHYLQDIETRGESFNTLYNLGSLSMETDEPGYSKYYLYKARELNPRDEDLNELLKKSDLKSIIISKRELFILALITLFISAALFLAISILKVFEKKFRILKNTLLISFPISSLLFITHFFISLFSYNSIVLENQEILISPYEGSEVTYEVNGGDEIKIKEDFKDFLLISTKDGKLGWIKSDYTGEL